jgi:hypothetical protein
MDVEVIYKNLHKTIKLIPESFIHHPRKGANGIFRPNGITSHSKSPLLVINAIFFTSSGTILICQKLGYKS